MKLMKPIGQIMGGCTENIAMSNAAVRIAVDIRNSIEQISKIVRLQEQEHMDFVM